MVGVLYLVYDWLFSRKAVYEQRGWYPEGRVLRRKDRSIVYEGDPDDPVVSRRRMTQNGTQRETTS